MLRHAGRRSTVRWDNCDSSTMAFQGHQARKRFGQHWLKDQTVLDRILVAADLRPSDRVLEVGPGRGALTERLLSSPAAAVQAVELIAI